MLISLEYTNPSTNKRKKATINKVSTRKLLTLTRALDELDKIAKETGDIPPVSREIETMATQLSLIFDDLTYDDILDGLDFNEIREAFNTVVVAMLGGYYQGPEDVGE